MPIDIAKSSIKKQFDCIHNKYSELLIEFGGGEPFFVYSILKEICEWTWSQKWSLCYTFFATTNGTLINEDTKRWLKKNNSKIKLCLSIDGTKYMHDVNRSNSFDKIDKDFFLETWPSQPVKMTVSRETLPLLSEGVQYLHKKGFRIDVNLANGIEWNDKSTSELFSQQLALLIKFYLDNPNIQPCSLFKIDFISLMNSKNSKKWCGVGTDMVTVDIDGIEYPCHMFQPLSIGNKSKKINEIDFYNVSELIDSECKDCIVYPVCPTCYGLNLLRYGNLAKRDKSLCLLNKIKLLACLKLETNKLINYEGEINEAQRMAAQSINYIYSKLIKDDSLISC